MTVCMLEVILVKLLHTLIFGLLCLGLIPIQGIYFFFPTASGHAEDNLIFF
jgi:hypothetical protein